MYASKGVKFGSHPLLDRVEQLHAADPLQLFRNPVTETYTDRHSCYIFKILSSPDSPVVVYTVM